VAGLYQKEQQSQTTTLEDAAFNRTLSRLSPIYEGRLDQGQLNELAKLAAANRSVFEQKLTAYLPTLKDADINRLSRVYYSEDKNARQNFEDMLRRHEPDLDTRRLDSIMKDVSADWANNQKAFEHKLKEYVPELDFSATKQIYSQWAELDRCNCLLSRAEYSAADAFKSATPSAKTELKESLNGVRALNQVSFNLLSRIASANGTELGMDLSALTQESLQRIAAPLNNAQRTSLFDLALETGFSSSVVNISKSYFKFMPAESVSSAGMQGILERIFSVDDLASRKLTELTDSSTKSKKLLEDAQRMLLEADEGQKNPRKDLEPADLSQANTLRTETLKEAQGVENARKSLLRKMPLENAFRDPKFEDIFEQHRIEESTSAGIRKYFKSGAVPVKVKFEIANIRPPEIANYGPVAQLGLLRAYRKTLQDYERLTPKTA
jgi:hypothetical protein